MRGSAVITKITASRMSVQNEMNVQVREVVVHSDYRGESQRYAQDIALLVLTEKVVFNNFVMPACVDYNLQHTDELFKNTALRGYVRIFSNTVVNMIIIQPISINFLTIQSGVPTKECGSRIIFKKLICCKLNSHLYVLLLKCHLFLY